MTPLKEMYDRLAELKAKEKRYSEDEAEISELNALIAAREKYLHRYIDHPPYMVRRMTEALKEFNFTKNDDVTRLAMTAKITTEVHDMTAQGQIFGRMDAADMAFYLNKNLVVS